MKLTFSILAQTPRKECAEHSATSPCWAWSWPPSTVAATCSAGLHLDGGVGPSATFKLNFTDQVNTELTVSLFLPGHQYISILVTFKCCIIIHWTLEARETSITCGLTSLPRRERQRLPGLSWLAHPTHLISTLEPSCWGCNSVGSVTFRHIMCPYNNSAKRQETFRCVSTLDHEQFDVHTSYLPLLWLFKEGSGHQ